MRAANSPVRCVTQEGADDGTEAGSFVITLNRLATLGIEQEKIGGLLEELGTLPVLCVTNDAALATDHVEILAVFEDSSAMFYDGFDIFIVEEDIDLTHLLLDSTLAATELDSLAFLYTVMMGYHTIDPKLLNPVIARFQKAGLDSQSMVDSLCTTA